MEKTNENKNMEVINEQTTEKVITEKESNEEVKTDSIVNKTESQTTQNKKTPKNESKKKKIILGVVIGVVSLFLAFVIAIVSIVCIVISSTRVSLDDYVTGECQFTGANGYGSVYAEDIIDYDALDDKIMDENANDGYSWFYGYTSSNDYIDITYPENNGSLSNGDTVEITVNIDKDGMKNDSSFKKTISGDEIQVFTYTVSGLVEVEEIDIFDAVENVVYDTTSDNVFINYKKDYTRDYGNGISVKYTNSTLNVFLNGECCCEIYIYSNTENLSTDNPQVTLYTNSDNTQYIESNFVLSEIERVFEADVVTYMYSMNIKDNEIKTLKKNADSYMDSTFGVGKHKYQKTIAYYDSSDNGDFVGLLIFYYEVDGKIYAAIYEHLKQDQNGNVYNIDQLEIKTFKTWLWNEIIGEEKIEDFETKHMTYVKKEDVKIPN